MNAMIRNNQIRIHVLIMVGMVVISSLCWHRTNANDLAANNRAKTEWFWQAHHRDVTSLSLSPTKRLLLSTSLDGAATLWHLPTGTLIHQIPTQAEKVLVGAFVGDDLMMTSQQTNATPQGITQTLNIWTANHDVQLETKVSVPRYNPWVGTVAPGGDVIVAPVGANQVGVWSLDVHNKLRRELILELPDGQITAIGVSPNETVVGVGSDEGDIYLFALKDGKPIGKLNHSHARVSSIAFVGSNILMSAGYGGRIIKWNWTDKRQLGSVTIQHARIQDLAPITEGNEVYAAVNRVEQKDATIQAWGTVQLWDLSTGKRIDIHKVTAIWIDAVVYDPLIPAVIAGDSHGTIHVWPVGQILGEAKGVGGTP